MLTNVGTETRWVAVCAADAIVRGRGVAALVEGEQVAVFLLDDGELAAIGNVDPISGVGVLSRGIVGDHQGTPTVASPLYKQRFDLRSGRCLDAAGVQVEVHDVRVDAGRIEVRLRA